MSIREYYRSLLGNDLAISVFCYLLTVALINIFDRVSPGETVFFSLWWAIATLCLFVYGFYWLVAGRYFWYARELLRINHRMRKHGSRNPQAFADQETAICYLLGRLQHPRHKQRVKARQYLRHAHATGELLPLDNIRYHLS